MNPHSERTEEVLSRLKTDSVSGLSSAEVIRRREKYGENKLKEKNKKGMLARFFEQFKDAMIIILLIACTARLTTTHKGDCQTKQ